MLNIKALIKASTEMSKFEIEVMIEKLAEWVGEDVTVEQLRQFVWAMAIDPDFEALIQKAVACERAEIAEMHGEEL
jgi:hypothetical protein